MDRHARFRRLTRLILVSLMLRFASAPRPGIAQGIRAAPAARATSGNVVATHLGKGYDALKQDRYDIAVQEFRAALALDPKLVLRARFPLGIALMELHRYDEARREFEAVRRQTGEHPNVMYYLGRLDLTEGKLDAAISELTKATARPPFPDTAYYLGEAYLKQGNMPLAEQWLKKAAEADPQDSRILYRLSFVYRQQGRESEAQQALARSQEMQQRQAEQSRLRMQCIQKLSAGPVESARSVCEQLNDPDDVEKLTILGTVYGQFGDYQDALKPLQLAAQLAPHSPQMQYNLAFDYFQLGRFEDARATLENPAKEWPDLFQLQALYGAILFKLGKTDPAYEALHRAHQLNPDDAGTAAFLYQAALLRAEKSVESREYAVSLRYLKEAAEIAPRESEPHRRMAEVYALTNQQAQAEQERELAKRLAGGSTKQD